MPWPKISNRTFHDNISKECLSSYQSQGESDGGLPNGVLFFESVGRISNVSECDRANDGALFLQSFTRSYSFFSLSENERWNFCQILTLAVLGYKLGIKTKVV